MQYDHARTLREMLDKAIPQVRIMEYFQKEGYSESDVLSEINAYEQEKTLSSQLKTLSTTPPVLSMEGTPAPARALRAAKANPTYFVPFLLAVLLILLIIAALFFFG